VDGSQQILPSPPRLSALEFSLISFSLALSSACACLPAALLQKSSKVLADAMEALLGAFLVAGGHTAALAFLRVSCTVG